MNFNRGFVYVATGNGYIAEAINSARQLKKIHPECRICLIADYKDEDLSIFDDLIPLENSQVSHSPIDKVYSTLCPYSEAIFLDTDTYAVAKIDELFDLLKRFDLALLPETKRGWDYKLPDVPTPFAEYNTGVIVFKNSERVNYFFQKWKSEYFKLKKELDLKNDQASFRLMAWNSEIKITPIPSEFHFLSESPNYIMWNARLLHGRNNLPLLAGKINKNLGSRVYIPNVGTISGYSGSWDWIKKLTSFLFRSMSLIWRKNLSKPAPKKWW